MTLSRSNPRAKQRWAVLGLTLTMAFLVTSAAVVLALTPGSFESSDGNLAVNGASPNKDWNSYADGSALATTDNFAQQLDAGREYAGGMKHDDACPTLSGTATTENVLTKGDFTKMYIAYEDVGGNTLLYLSWQRVVQNSTSNSAHASFIFAQADLEDAADVCPNGVTPVRMEDDMLVTFDFFGGAGDAQIALSRWITTGAGSDCESNYQNIPADGCWGDVTTFTGPLANVGHGAVNTRTKVPTAECSVSKNPLGAVSDAIPNPDKCLGELEFGEAAVNLTAAGVFDTSQDCISFGSVHVGSRASGNSFDAQLKDLIVPLPINLTNCAGIEITKTDDAGTALAGVTFTLHEDDEGEPGDATAFTCTTDDDGVCTISDVFPGTYWVVESGLPDGHAADEDLPYFLELTEDDVNTTIELTFVNPRERGSILVEKTDGTDRIDGAAFVIDEDGNAETTDDQTAIPAVDGETGLFCLDGLLAGTYTVIETVVPDGYDGADPQDVDAVVPSTCADRVESEDDPDATFVNLLQPGDIEITKTDDDGNPLENVTFQLYEDDAGTQGDAITGKDCTTDSTGTCTIANVEAGTYWIDETNLGDDYSADSGLPEQITVAGGGATLELDYENPRLHRVIVLVCHQGTDTLHGSDVTIGTTTEGSLDGTGLTEAEQNALCTLGGASFDGYGHEIVDVEVDIGTH